MLFNKTPIGFIQVPAWEEKELINLTNEQLIQKAIDQNNEFCISPAVYALIEKRFLGRELQRRINPCVGANKFTEKYINDILYNPK